jgi:hypothetical protein
MKFKIFLVVFVSMFITASSFSQVKLGIGVEGGVNIANVTSTPDISSTSHTGLIIGGFLDIGVSKNLSVVPGLRFIMKGFTFTGTDPGNGLTYTATDKGNYLEIPLLLKVTFPLTEVKLYLFGGPELGINLSANQDVTEGGTTTTSDISSYISGTDFGLLFGGGVAFKLAPKTDLFVNVGYSFGLSNIYKNDPNITVKNTGIQLTAGAIFHL